MILMYENQLQHHGIKGMRWGHRKQKISSNKSVKKKQAENYSSKQRIRDKKIYGIRAEKRINKRILKGEGIQSARHNEVERKARKESAKKATKKILKIGTGVAITAGIVALTKKYGNQVVSAISENSEDVVRAGKHIVDAIIR